MSIAPKFSLIVSTLGRTKELELLFDSMTASEIKDFEVIVVNQNDNGSLDQLCHRYSQRFSLMHVKVQFTGLSRARNYGVRFASGVYLNFPDDDCELLPDTLTLAQDLLVRMNLKLLTGMSVDRVGHDSTTYFVHDERFLTLWSMWGRFIEFATFFEREAFLRIGGYDERFGLGSRYGADEGADLLIRLLLTLRPTRAYYSHRVRVVHPDKQNNFSPAGAERAFSYARGRGALAGKWSILPVSLAVFRYVAASALGTLVFRDGKRRTYWYRLKGFLSGYLEFKKAMREEYRVRARD
jgi:glycosyltransferase involved in cell wall biosynthesis